MIILYISYGNHSNRLFQTIHFEAFCKEYNKEYINPTFSDIRKYYISPCNLQKGILYIFFKSLLIRKIIRKLNLLKNFISFNNENQDNITELLLSINAENVYVAGWGFRVPDLTEKYQDYFIEKYTLKEKYYKNNALLDIIINQKNIGSIIIGVHIRKVDYKLWMDGKYYFDDDVYIKNMSDLEKEIMVTYNKKCIFIIFSNENVSLKNDGNIYISKNKWFVDHYLMSKCDYLIGPPSTFTLWASFIGKVKYYHIEDKNDDIKLNEFKYCKE